jgi:hypothetical protein
LLWYLPEAAESITLLRISELIEWNSMISGDCVTIFTPGELNKHFVDNLIIRWRWHDDGGFDNSLKTVISNPDINEAFLTCLDIADDLFDTYPCGIRMYEEDRDFLARHNLSIGGSSLGLALLFGLFCHVRSHRPRRIAAWGAILPVRNNRVAVLPTDAVEKKMQAALEIGAEHVIHPALEPEKPASGIRETRITQHITEAVKQLDCDALYQREN